MKNKGILHYYALTIIILLSILFIMHLKTRFLIGLELYNLVNIISFA